MSTATTETKTATTKSKPKKRARKKVPRAEQGKPRTAKKAAKKKVTKKTTKKTTKKKAAAKVTSSKDLSKPQVRVLEYLAKQKKPRTRKEIASGASTDLAMLNTYIGSQDPERRKTKPNCLWNKGYVKVTKEDIDGKDVVVHAITASGKKSLDKAKKAKS